MFSKTELRLRPTKPFGLFTKPFGLFDAVGTCLAPVLRVSMGVAWDPGRRPRGRRARWRFWTIWGPEEDCRVNSALVEKDILCRWLIKLNYSNTYPIESIWIVNSHMEGLLINGLRSTPNASHGRGGACSNSSSKGPSVTEKGPSVTQSVSVCGLILQGCCWNQAERTVQIAHQPNRRDTRFYRPPKRKHYQRSYIVVLPSCK